MSLTRREMLRTLGAAGAAVAATPGMAGAGEPARPPDDAVGLLYDATRCIGCQACTVACRDANGLDPAPADGMYYQTTALSARNKTVIQLYRDGERQSFMKMQCMHCVDPACVSACMLGSLQKRSFGAVTWDPDRCVGCRYCQVACPFGVPAFEWEAAAAPRIIKCELCSDRLAEGREPACTEVCPRDAVVFGPREELLAEGRRRIAERPDLYRDHIYGETEGGGTQVLYLTAQDVSFQDLGLPLLGERPSNAVALGVQHTVYKGFVAPVALYGLVATVIWRNRRAAAPAADEGEVQP